MRIVIDAYVTLRLPGLDLGNDTELFAKLLLAGLSNPAVHPSLGLERFCGSGGYPVDPEFHRAEVMAELADGVAGNVDFSFTEQVRTSCVGVSFDERVKGRLWFEHSRQTGEIRFAGGSPKREYDPEEF